MKKYRKYLILSFLVGALMVAFLVMPKRPAGPVLPIPNGYDDFVQAGRQAVSDQSLSFGEAEDDELRQLVKDNRSALDLARHGFARQCQVPNDYRFGTTAYWAKHSSELSRVKTVALAFRAEGELAQREGRTNDAVQAYLDGMRFGQEVCRGGLLIDRLVGIACEAIALKPLSNIAPNVDAHVCREIAQIIEQMNANREPMRVTWEEERIWSTRAGTLRERFTSLIERIFRRKSLQALQQSGDSKVVDLQLRQRRLLFQAAQRAYRLEQRKPAERAGDLVPEYLKAVPKDPVTGQDMAPP